MAKKGKAVYKSGDLAAKVDDCSISGKPMVTLYGITGAVLALPLEDVSDLREIVRMLETYELTGPYRRECFE
jgi:hypothetical protein